MAKLSLVAKPTFRAKVPVPVAGESPVDVEFTFKHRTKTSLVEFLSSSKDADDVDLVFDMCDAWELVEKFDRESVALLLENYPGAAVAILTTYTRQLGGHRLGN